MIKDLAVVVDGERIPCDVADLYLSENLWNDAAQVAAKVARWGKIVALAASAAARLKNQYTFWESGERSRLLSSDPKLAEWKADALIQASPAWLDFQERIVVADEVEGLARSMLNGYIRKSKVMESKAWIKTSELGAVAGYTFEPEDHIVPGEQS